MKSSSNKLLFTSAAIFNWAVGLALLLGADLLLGMFQVTPLPTETPFLRLFAGVVFVFGIGYYWAGDDPVANAPVIRLGVIGKLVVVAVAVWEVVSGSISWQFMLLASADLVFALLFLRVLVALRRAPGS